jgi:hypothetical protein
MYFAVFLMNLVSAAVILVLSLSFIVQYSLPYRGSVRPKYYIFVFGFFMI